ncbi:hypothetical protein UB46_36930 [Burkholderiaceae bacterium 16]|nr:hypothetical protein UB46_36930 [Burkholderiaceae bacterium 16]
MVSTNPEEHAISRIPGVASLSFEARSKSVETLEGFYQLLRAECKAISRDRGVRFEFDPRIESAPAIMDGKLSGRSCYATFPTGTVDSSA